MSDIDKILEELNISSDDDPKWAATRGFFAGWDYGIDRAFESINKASLISVGQPHELYSPAHAIKRVAPVPQKTEHAT